MDALRDFHGAPPLWIFLNVIIGLSYLQQISWKKGSLTWQDILGFEEPKHSQEIGCFLAEFLRQQLTFSLIECRFYP